jgi:hypothetical protein
MSHLEPSYLRYIYDGLEKGDLHPDNAAALPEGLIGLYEAAFEESKTARERQKLLETFAVWALLKKEVSAQFVAEILDVPTQEITDFIATYSSWFSSPESGKYQLYHERLKVYLLQKLSEKEIATLHNKFITRLEQAIEVQKQDEFELYGLEFLSVHYFTTAMLTGDGTILITLSYNQNHWQRQLKLSKGFEWTKKGLKQVLNWASKYNDEEVIECGLQMVDLYHQEQNDVPQIVALVADGDIDTALKRIEVFGGNDKEGLQSKFILYMLCLMELTLLDSKDKPFRKATIEKILKHYEENLVTDYSIFNWNDFFPSYLVFLISSELAQLGLDYLSIYKKAGYWEDDWLFEKEIYNISEIEFLCILYNYINNEGNKNTILVIISDQLTKLKRLDKALVYALEIDVFKLDINHREEVARVISNISIEYAKIGNFEEAINCLEKLDNHYWKSFALASISSEIDLKERTCFSENSNCCKIKINGNYITSTILMKEALDCVHYFTHPIYKTKALANISTELAKQGKVSLAKPNNVGNEFSIEELLKEIEEEKYSFSATSVMNDAIKWAKDEEMHNQNKIESLAYISTELVKQGQLQKANLMAEETLYYYRSTDEDDWGFEGNKIDSLIKISRLFSDQGDFEKAKSILREALKVSKVFENEYQIKKTLLELSKLGQIIEYQEFIKYLKEIKYKCEYLAALSTELIKQNQQKSAIVLIKEAIELTNKMCDDSWDKIEVLKFISNELTKQHLHKINFTVINLLVQNVNGERYLDTNLSPEKKKINTILEISTEMAKKGQFEKSLILIKEISDDRDKIYALVSLSFELAKGKWNDKAASVIQKAIEYTRCMKSEPYKIKMLADISSKLAEQGQLALAASLMQEAILNVNSMNDDGIKNSILSNISENLTKQGKFEDAYECIQELLQTKQNQGDILKALEKLVAEIAKKGNVNKALNYIEKINENLYEKNSALAAISIEMTKKGQFKTAEDIINKISNDDWVKSRALSSLAFELAKENRIDEALNHAHIISDEEHKSVVLSRISTLLLKYGNVKDANAVIYDAVSFAQLIDNKWIQGRTLSRISMELIVQGNWNFAEKVGLEIKDLLLHNDCWIEIAKINMEKKGLKDALFEVHNFKNYIPKTFYLKGLANNLSAIEFNTHIVLDSYRYYINDNRSLEKILYQYALNQLFFENLPEEKIQRYNRTLNIQWAIDIKNQLPN